MTQQSKVIDIQRGINDQVSGFKESTIDHGAIPHLNGFDPFAQLLERDNSTFRMPLMEALVLKPDAANMLRDGIRFLSFQTMRGIPRTWDQIARRVDSARPEEEYLRDAAFGVIPKKPSGQAVDFVNSSFEGGVKIVNDMYRMGVMITGDDIRFDRLGKINQIAFELGRSAIATEEATFYGDITTVANYGRNSTTKDNDVGPNTAATTFNALGLDTALTTIATSKDRISGQYLGYRADTILTTPKMEMPVKQMLMSVDLNRQAVAASAEVRGMGTMNPYQGLLSKIIVSPWFGASYEWATCDSTAYSYVWQVVEGWQIMQEPGAETSEAWLINNAIRYVISGYFGHGFVDDRAWYYSSSSTAPTVS